MEQFRSYSVLSGLVGLISFVLFLSVLNGPLGAGGMERLVVTPLLVWTVVVIIHLIRSTTSSLIARQYSGHGHNTLTK